MKIITFLIILFSIITYTYAQHKIGQKIKDNVNQRADEKVDKAINVGPGKTDEGTKTKTKTKTESNDSGTDSQNSADAPGIERDGKGAADPASPNTTAEGKANNRRVEFIKQLS